MNRIFKVIEDKMESVLLPFAVKMNAEPHLSALKTGMAISLPLMIIGGIAMLLAVPPVPATSTNAFLLAWKAWAGANNALLMAPYNLTLGVISVYVVIGVSSSLAKEYKLNAMTTSTIALFVFWLTTAAPVGTAEYGLITQMGNLGAVSMFYAIIVSFIVCDVTKFFMDKNIKIRLPEQVPPNVTAPFEALIPAVVITLVFLLGNMVCVNLTGANLSRLVFSIFQPLMSASSSLPSVILISVLLSTFWFFGIHGNNMLGGVLTPIATANLVMNAEVYITGVGKVQPLAGAFMTIFGNWMSYPAMMVCFFLVARSSQLKSIRGVALLPDIFNINEPLTFGVPVVMNFLVALPIMIANVITCTIAYLAMSSGLVNSIAVSLPFTVPGPLNLFISTNGDIRSLILWAALFVLDIVILLPFIRTYDNQLLKEENSQVQ